MSTSRRPARRPSRSARRPPSSRRRPPPSGGRPQQAAAAGQRRPAPPRRPAPGDGARRPWYRRPVALLLVIPALALVFVAVVGISYVAASVPLPADLGATATVVKDLNGVELGTLQPQREREDVPLDTLPPHVVDAVLAAEDDRFYEHRGVSIPGLFRAAFVNLVAGEVRQGGSTISQQYVKNHVLSDRSRTVVRKLREAVLAVKLERQYSKDEILSFYVNTVYFGRGAYGIQAAAKAYYGKPAAELSVPEAAQLAGLIPAPSNLDPLRNPEGAEQRYRYVLRRMVETRRLEAVDAGRFAAEPPVPIQPEQVTFKEAPALFGMVEEELQSRLGDGIYQGLEVTTTLDVRMQRAADAAYGAGFKGLPVDGEGNVPTGAMVALDPASGGVRAIVGGPPGEQINLAWKNRRQPGSTFKIFALAAWIDDGRSPESFFDGPATYTIEGADGGADYEIDNYGNTAYGELSLREATWKSVNTVYAQVLEEVGTTRFIELARAAGIERELPREASIVLGTPEVSPLELAETYNTFAANGMHHEPFVVQEVRRDDAVLFRRPERGEQAVTTRTASNVTDVLRGVISSGTGQRADIGRPAAGKTGTTQEYGDAWFAGYTPDLTAVVWMGHRDNNKPMAGEYTGGSLPARVWADFMRRALEGIPATGFPKPEGGLTVVRPSPTPTQTVPECAEGEELVEVTNEDGSTAMACRPVATASPTPSPTPSEPEPDTTGVPAPSPSPTVAPDPVPTPTPSPAPSPSPSPTRFPIPGSSPPTSGGTEQPDAGGGGGGGG